MDKRLFTVQEANELIPFLTEELSHLHRLMQQLHQLDEIIGVPDEQDITLNGGTLVHPRRFEILTQVRDGVTDISQKGCVIKDLDQGLVDFPTLWEGREVYLCWRLGEDEVTFWHELEEGFGGRQEIAANRGGREA